MAREIVWRTNWRGERVLPAQEFVRQREALDPREVRYSSPSCPRTAPGVQRFTDGGLTVDIMEGGKSAPVKFTVLKTVS